MSGRGIVRSGNRPGIVLTNNLIKFIFIQYTEQDLDFGMVGIYCHRSERNERIIVSHESIVGDVSRFRQFLCLFVAILSYWTCGTLFALMIWLTLERVQK